MATDIFLNDDNDSIELIGSLVRLKSNTHTNSPVEFNLLGGKAHLKFGNQDSSHNSISIVDKRGRTRLSGGMGISTNKIATETAIVNNLEIGALVREGTAAETGKIQIYGKNGKSAITLNGESGAIEFGNGTRPMFYLLENGTNNPDRPIFSHSKQHPNWGLLYRDNGDKMIFQSGGEPILAADLGGKKVGIGTDNPSHTLHVEGEVAGRGNFKSLSDARCKQNVDVIPHCLDKIMCLQGVSFNWNENDLTGKNPPKEKQLGFIAQDVEKIIPEAVSKDLKGRRSLAYSSIIPLLVEAVKSQQNEIRLQNTKIKSQHDNNVGLQERINNMEGKLSTLMSELREIKNA